MKTFLFSIIILFVGGCEVRVNPHAPYYTYDEYGHATYVTNKYDSWVDPNYVDYPYDQSPYACYYHHGVEYCEWIVRSAPYSECIETWYYDEYFRLWDFYNESCYAI